MWQESAIGGASFLQHDVVRLHVTLRIAISTTYIADSGRISHTTTLPLSSKASSLPCCGLWAADDVPMIFSLLRQCLWAPTCDYIWTGGRSNTKSSYTSQHCNAWSWSHMVSTALWMTSWSPSATLNSRNLIRSRFTFNWRHVQVLMHRIVDSTGGFSAWFCAFG